MLYETLQNARSYRTFDQSQPLSMADLRYLVDCTRFTPSAVNFQPIKYRLTADFAEAEKLTAATGWAGRVKIKLPPDGKHPTAFITICVDKNIHSAPRTLIDVGIVAQTIILAATECGYGGCMIGSFKAAEISEILSLPENCVPELVIGLGKPAETCVVCDLSADGDTCYFRDDANIHYVPKRSVDELIISNP